MILPQCTGANPCCADGSCCPSPLCSGGPPPPPGQPIDNYIIFLFAAALIYGIYIIKKGSQNYAR
ncbi:hypothetical protein [uncultured Winogradskyella sp.]|jgi:hypothetical protein|uniref:hypothetical protein n=1 Tax=uncultured Winogradskyella sp. TaxID=395353 RepID=UPI0025D6C005|nr:hypothetical protein [uncultured Winogradskyella sp.]